MRTRRNRFALLLLFALAAALVPLVASTSTPATAQDRQVTLTPGTGIAAGQVVNVTWSGFAPGPVSIYQCTAGAATWAQCAEVTYVRGVTSEDGTGSTSFPVWRGVPLPSIPVVGSPNFPIPCNASFPCDVVVSECGFDIDSDHAARAPIGFAPGGANPAVTTTTAFNTTTTSIPDTPPVDADPIVTAYSGSTHLLMADMQVRSRQAPIEVNLDLIAQNSPNADEQFTAGVAETAVSALGLTADQLASLAEQKRDVAYVPVAVSALTVGMQLRVNGIEMEKFSLGPDTLSQAYQGQLSSYNDQPIVDDNAGCSIQINGRRYPVSSYRGDVSAANLTFTTWLDSQAPSWGLGVGQNMPVEDSQVYGRPSAEDLAKFIAFGDLAIDHASNSNAGRWGFVDRSFARAYGLTEVAVKNAAGRFVQPTDEAILAGVDAAYEPGRFFAPAVDSAAPASYPMPTVYYAIVQTNLTETFTQENADDLKTFLTYLAGDGQARAAELGFVPLPTALQAEATENIAKIGTTDGNAPQPPPSDSTSPPPSSGGSGSPSGSSTVDSSSAALRGLASSSLGDVGDALTVADVTVTDVDDGPSGPLGFIQSVLDNPGTLIALPVLLFLGLAAVVAGQLLKRSRGAKAAGTG
jgi:ABC-type phosphate transport system substrate-binding protein